MKLRFISVFLLVILAFSLASCAQGTDITGSYTVAGMDNVYTFTSDGKIYCNDETESISRYRVKGNTIITYIDGVEETVELPFKKTEDGFMMGDVEYRLLPEYPRDTQQTDDSAAAGDLQHKKDFAE